MSKKLRPGPKNKKIRSNRICYYLRGERNRSTPAVRPKGHSAKLPRGLLALASLWKCSAVNPGEQEYAGATICPKNRWAVQKNQIAASAILRMAPAAFTSAPSTWVTAIPTLPFIRSRRPTISCGWRRWTKPVGCKGDRVAVSVRRARPATAAAPQRSNGGREHRNRWGLHLAAGDLLLLRPSRPASSSSACSASRITSAPRNARIPITFELASYATAAKSASLGRFLASGQISMRKVGGWANAPRNAHALTHDRVALCCRVPFQSNPHHAPRRSVLKRSLTC